MIVDVEPAGCGVRLCGLYGLGCCVDPRDPGPETGHRLGKQPAAAADVEDPEPLGAAIVTRSDTPDAVENVVDPHRCEVVKRCHRPAFIPPVRRHGGEIVDFFLVRRRVHGLAPFGRYSYESCDFSKLRQP